MDNSSMTEKMAGWEADMAGAMEQRAAEAQRMSVAMREASRIVREAAAGIRSAQNAQDGLSRMTAELSELVSRLAALRTA